MNLMCKTRTPTFNFERGCWMNGHPGTLYTFIDKRTGHFVVRPGERGRHATGIGPECQVRVATRSEAEEKWQSPLNPAWYVEG
jgi:hypothetical protein